MCIIIYKPKAVNKNISLDEIIRGYKQNPHGMGVYYRKDKRSFVEKFVPSNVDHVINYFCGSGMFSDQDGADIVIHFRACTAGKVTKENCHPFDIGDGWQMFHNGHITGYSNGIDESDSNLYSADLRNILNNGEINSLADNGELSDMIRDGYNKFVVCPTISDHDPIIVTPKIDGGLYMEGIWYSNGSLQYRW